MAWLPPYIRKIATGGAMMFLASFFFGPQAGAAEEVAYKKYKDSGDSHIRITSVFGGGKTSGYAPFRVVIRNNTDRDRTWNIRIANDGSWGTLNYVRTARYEVASGAELRTDLYVPVPPLIQSSSYYQNWSVTATSPGLESLTGFLASQAVAQWPSLAISQPLARRSLSSLDARKRDLKYGEEPFAHIFELDQLPKEWVGYTCLDAMMMDQKTWTELESVQRQAIVEWLRVGGRMEFFSASGGFDLIHPALERAIPGEAKTWMIGRGSLHLRDWNGDELPESLVSEYRSSIPVRNEYISSNFDSSWQLKRQFGKKQFNVLLIFLILFSFAIVIGPVNLFWLAKSGQRHRLFITTPLISIAAVILMSVLIYFQDGLGGEGTRVALAELQANSDEMRLYLIQEQYSRTGVIVRTGFTGEESMEISPVKLPASPWNPLSSRSGMLGRMNFTGNQYSGDFFTSRSEQAYAIRTVRPTRARIEVRTPIDGEHPPDLLSNLPFAISDFLYRSPEGHTFRSPPGTRIDPGNPLQLSAIPEPEYTKWVEENSRLFTRTLSNSLRAYRRTGDIFFARVADPEELLVSTHPGIEWENDRVILTGSLNPPGTSKPASGTPTEGEEVKP